VLFRWICICVLLFVAYSIEICIRNLFNMAVTRFPDSGLTSEYGNIILSGVAQTVTLKITLDTEVLLQETYTPDADDIVVIPDIGKLAFQYITRQSLALANGLDSGSVTLNIKLTENGNTPTITTKDVTFFRSDVNFNGSITPELIALMPLSRSTNKITGPGRKETISFYDHGDVSLYAVYSNGTKDVGTTIAKFAELDDDGEMRKLLVSPAVIAAAVECDVSDLVYYNLYKDESAMIRFKMDHRNYQNKTTFVFVNSLGAQETITFTGHDVYEKKWSREFGFSSDQIVQTYKDNGEKIKVNTGYVVPSMHVCIEDLLNSDSVCVLNGDTLYPVVIIDEDFNLTTKKNQAQSFIITYRYASNIIQTKYTPLAKPGLFGDTFDQTFE
jgi:hypothetical protein